MTSEITETRAFVGSFVKEIRVSSGSAEIHYTIPTPEDSPIGSVDNSEVSLDGRVMSPVVMVPLSIPYCEPFAGSCLSRWYTYKS